MDTDGLDGSEKVGPILVVTGGDAAELLEAAEDAA